MTVSTDGLTERRDVVVVVWLLERADDADAGSARLAIEANQFTGVSTTSYVLFFHFNIHQTVTLCDLQRDYTATRPSF